ncbi:TetR family transcriptional regulator [Xanthomonas sp. AM6]|uniref:TetR/AcrR family transcriptional regulator n=1 Tax=Xanthomonas sp. AM6 TaxID=2982531 RepID=UPI0021DB40B1|nr:TetR family transcriptional regulator [Xanthomonas sp. AM6]UYB51778.1 TetR family transcriptional regulator [Xanthomonas sp. AM6]
MSKPGSTVARGPGRREASLSRERIVEASIALLDSGGEGGLTFRALSERLATGAGAIYWHVENKSDLLTAACDAIVIRTLASTVADTAPAATIRALALGMFDTLDAHPWVGSALMHGAGQLPLLRIVECLGRQVRALGVADGEQWAAVSALLHYILGVAGQNAANTQFARARGIDRDGFLGAMADAWAQLDPDAYPFVRSVAGQLRDHDDRSDFLAGVDLILGGLETRRIAGASAA